MKKKLTFIELLIAFVIVSTMVSVMIAVAKI